MQAFLILFLAFLSCVRQPVVTQAHSSSTAVQTQNLLGIPEAERILGEKVMLADSATTINNKILTYNCSFQAVTVDSVSGKTGNIYFMFEKYTDPEPAHHIYEDIRKANETHEGLTQLVGVGDEAYFHTDHQNFYFVLARKGNSLIRMKVNKVTSHTSLDEFNAVTKEIILKL